MPASLKKRSEIVAIYCPLWHNYDHASSWKGEGWCEWELLKTAIPRFPGHYQPLQPEWGCFDESDPKWSAREISLAAAHGIDVLLFDWYWYSGVKIMEEALERGFLKAPNRRRLKFALMWANHHWTDYFPPPFGQPWNSWLPIRHSARDWLRVIDYCIAQYFREPNYWRVDGRLFFSLFNPEHLLKELGGPAETAKVFAAGDRRLKRAGLPPLHLNAMTWGPDPVEKFHEAGFHSTTRYNVVSAGKVSADLTENYADLIAAHKAHWERMAKALPLPPPARGGGNAPLPDFPVVTMGWDVTPRCDLKLSWPFPPDPRTKRHDYPYCALVLGNTPERFGELCAAAREAAAGKPVFVNAWNEWTEGSYLLPEKKTGLAYLKALKAAFK